MKIKNPPGAVTVVNTTEVMINKNSDGTFSAGFVGKPLYPVEGRIPSNVYNDDCCWNCNFKPDAKVYSNYRDVWKIDGRIRYGIVIIDDDTGKITFYKCDNDEESEFISDEGVVVAEARIFYGSDYLEGQYRLGYIKLEDRVGYVFDLSNEIPIKSWEVLLYEDEEIRVKKSFQKFYLEFDGKEYEIKSMIGGSINNSDFKNATSVYRTFLPNAKIMTEWKLVSFPDKTKGLEIKDPNTGETKFYWYLVKEGKPRYLAEDGERQIYEANVVCDGPYPKEFLVGFIAHEGLDPEKINQ